MVVLSASEIFEREVAIRDDIVKKCGDLLGWRIQCSHQTQGMKDVWASELITPPAMRLDGQDNCSSRVGAN